MAVKIDLSSIDTSRCKYDPKKDNFMDLLNDIPEFKEYKAPGKMSKQRIFTFLVLMYDPNSPMRMRVGDYSLRKIDCMRIVGYSNNGKDGTFSGDIENILLGNDVGFNVCVAKYFMLLADTRLMELDLFYTMLNNLFVEIKSGKYQGKIKDGYIAIGELSEGIRSLENNIFGGDEVRDIRKQLYASVTKDDQIRPENIGEMLKGDGELPDSFNPYGNGYSVDKLKFMGDE